MNNTNDLISRAAATRAAVISVRDYLGNIDSERDIHIEEGLHEVPTVDAVSVVRCKNCRHYNTTCCSEGLGWCECRNFGIRDEWYCADGEAKTNVDD